MSINHTGGHGIGGALASLDRRRLAALMREFRDRTLGLVADLDEQQMIGPRLAIVNPPLWEIGHIAWFTEFWLLRHLKKQKPLLPNGDQLYNSSDVAHDTRWELLLPSRNATLDYMGEVLDRARAGPMLHVIEDSFAAGHTGRRVAAAPFCPFGTVEQFRAYQSEDPDKHALADAREALEAADPRQVSGAPSVRAGMTESIPMAVVRMSNDEGSVSATTVLRWKIRETSAQHRLDPDLDRFGDGHSQRRAGGQAGLVLRSCCRGCRAGRRPRSGADDRARRAMSSRDASDDRTENRAGHDLLLVG